MGNEERDFTKLLITLISLISAITLHKTLNVPF